MNDLSKLIAEYVDDDDPAHVMQEIASMNYHMMREYDDGVPSGVMFAANTMAMERVVKMLAGMVIDLGGQVFGWTDEEKTKQEALTLIYIDLIVADSMRKTLSAMRRGGEEGPEDE